MDSRSGATLYGMAILWLARDDSMAMSRASFFHAATLLGHALGFNCVAAVDMLYQSMTFYSSPLFLINYWRSRSEMTRANRRMRGVNVDKNKRRCSYS